MTGKIQWKRDEIAGTWDAYLNGTQIASCGVHEGTPTGYHGRYRGALTRALLPGEGVYRKRQASSLREFKAIVQAGVDALPAGSVLRRMNISRDMMLDIAGLLNRGGTWGEIGNFYGIAWQTLRAAYLRKSAEVYGGPRDGTL
jgi:hypothetical protein